MSGPVPPWTTPPPPVDEVEAWRERALAGWAVAALPPTRPLPRRAASRAVRLVRGRVLAPAWVGWARVRAGRRA